MHHYTAYGLSIDSELALPELLPCNEPAAVKICLRAIDRSDLSLKPGDPASGYATVTSAKMWFADAGTFFVQNGNEIIVDPEPGAEERTIRLYLLGPVLGVLLHQRGLLVLHASSILVHGTAVAFVADKGTGKSTLAAAFHAGGFTLVADDLVAVDVDAIGGPLAYPGFPQLKLYPEAAAQLTSTPDALPTLMPNFDKRACRSEGPFAHGVQPIRRVYVLTDGDEECIQTLPPQQAFMQLVRHSFLLSAVQVSGTQAHHLKQVGRLASQIKVQQLGRRRVLSILPDVVRMVEADCAAA